MKRLDVSAGGVHEHLTLYAAPSSPKQQLAPHQLECETLLFHGCSDKVDEALLESFSILGPSVHFSRPRGYFSRQPAVYWTDNLQFAIGWCVFTQTGRWITEISSMPDGLECLIYVSRVNLATIAQQFCAHFVPSPRCTLDEQKLVDWCVLNMEKGPDSGRIPPPDCQRSEWDLVGSRVPKHTLDGLRDAGLAVHQEMWLYAACSEAVSHTIATCGVEIMHVTNRRLSTKL